MQSTELVIRILSGQKLFEIMYQQGHCKNKLESIIFSQYHTYFCNKKIPIILSHVCKCSLVKLYML